MTKKNKIEHRDAKDTTKKQILAASGNQCAFPACSDIIFDSEHLVIVGKIAHIKARREYGPRFDYSQSEEENRSFSNLMALCGKHHDIVDNRKDIYTAEKLVSMKIEHEEKVENSADRSWITFPSSIVRPSNIEGLGAEQIYFWIDRTGRPQIYSDRKLAIARTVFDIWTDINQLCQLYEMVEQNPEAPSKSLLQSYVRLNKSKANLDEKTNWTPFVHILCQMAEVPEVTFGELLTYMVKGGDATSLFTERSRVLNKKIEKLSKAETT
jgi:hypothetical protein